MKIVISKKAKKINFLNRWCLFFWMKSQQVLFRTLCKYKAQSNRPTKHPKNDIFWQLKTRPLNFPQQQKKSISYYINKSQKFPVNCFTANTSSSPLFVPAEGEKSTQTGCDGTSSCCGSLGFFLVGSLDAVMAPELRSRSSARTQRLSW